MGHLIVWAKRGTSPPHSSKQPLNDVDIERIKDIANIQLERANAVAHAMSQRDDDSEVDKIKVDDDDDDSAWVDEDDEAMDDDATKDFVSPKQNGDLSEYNLDTYDEEDDGPASTACRSVSNGSTIQFRRLESMDTEDGPGSRFGNYVAIGTLEPEIEIYSIDLLDSVARPRGRGHGQEEKAKHRSASEAHHVDAIVSLSWNRIARQMLASGSADRTVKLGSYDRTVRVFDSRAPDASVGAVVGADVESIRWDPSDNR
ncbi:hypothetical protein EDB92DRAFT_1969660 [Lactarius akahatsu]|uniref:Uncharacterized protein n=1 Tax=Lactarius akahatsu TaxID=416441 RepID=A0AAD4L8K5_9AGAM|nr:hypothetical protein EDB92DRAFT_1969660 [Lactarius akahatsu]